MDKFLVKGGYSRSPSYEGCQYLNEAISVVIDSSLPWLTKTLFQWRHLTPPVPVTMSSESSVPRALISICGRCSWGLVPHVSCSVVLSSLSSCAFTHSSQRLCSCPCAVWFICPLHWWDVTAEGKPLRDCWSHFNVALVEICFDYNC